MTRDELIALVEKALTDGILWGIRCDAEGFPKQEQVLIVWRSGIVEALWKVIAAGRHDDLTVMDRAENATQTVPAAPAMTEADDTPSELDIDPLIHPSYTMPKGTLLTGYAATLAEVTGSTPPHILMRYCHIAAQKLDDLETRLAAVTAELADAKLTEECSAIARRDMRAEKERLREERDRIEQLRKNQVSSLLALVAQSAMKQFVTPLSAPRKVNMPPSIDK